MDRPSKESTQPSRGALAAEPVSETGPGPSRATAVSGSNALSQAVDAIHRSPAVRAQRQLIQRIFGASGTLDRAPPALQRRANAVEPESPHHTGHVMARQGGSATEVAGTAPAVQRRVHEWKSGAWKPGQAEAEGQKPFPQQPADGQVFFNDVTGRSGKTAKEAARSLQDLAVQQGSVVNVMADGGEALAAVDIEMKRTFAHDKENQTKYLGYFHFDKADETWKWDAGGDRCTEGAWTDMVKSFLRAFMIANGQLDYIRTRDWFINGTHRVEIDVNYYINRAFNTAPPYWHKDTGGGNLFVNLIFTNSEPIVGTEVTADTRPMGGAKRESLLANMPAEQVEQIEGARQALGGGELAGAIGAEVLPAKGFVSWVDELIWHSSPFMANRKRWTPDLAHDVMSDWVDLNPFFKSETATSYEAMVVIASQEGTALRAAVEQEGVDLDIGTARGYWDNGYCLDGEHHEIVEADLAMVDWSSHKLNDAFGHEQDGSDPRVAPREGQEKPANLVTPSSIAGRPRALSDADIRGRLAPMAQNKMGRNFMRTWVRIKPKKG